jgi:hypothetical protein
MTEQKNVAECCSGLLFLNIFKTFRIAIQPARFLTAFLALAVVFIAGWLMDFSKTVVVSGQLTQRELRTSALTGSVGWPTELHCFVSDSERIDDFIKRYKNQPEKQGVFKVWSNFCLTRFNQAAASVVMLNFGNFVTCVTESVAACIWALKYHTIYSIIFLLIALALVSAAGGAICRGAALQFSKDEKPGIIQCLRFVLKKFVSFFFAPLAPVILIAIFGLGIFLLGLITNIPWAGELIMALFIIVVLVAGLLMTFAIIGLGAGVNLMFGTVAYENSDAFDAVSRSFSYVYSKPWRLSFYTLLAAVYGSISYLFVRFFAFVLLGISRWFMLLGIWTSGNKAEQLNKLVAIWPKPEFFNLLGGGLEVSKNATESIAAFVVQLAVLVVAGMVVAFAVSFYFSASTIIYCLLRNKVDNTALDNIFIEAEQTEQTAQLGQTQSSELPE